MPIITRLKNALEFVRFADPNIREAYVDALNELAADMKEVEFEEAVATRAAFDKLDAAITEFENRDQVYTEGKILTLPDEDVDGAPETTATAGADEEVDVEPPVVVDDDDIDL